MKINGIEVHHLPVTLRNEQVCKAAYLRVKEFMQSRSIEATLRNIARLRANHEELAELIDEVGMLNIRTILARALTLQDAHKAEWEYRGKLLAEEGKEQGEYEPMPGDAAQAIAKEELQASLTTYLKDKPEIGKSLYFDVEAFPASLEALKMGIAIIRETCDRERITSDESAKIDSDNDSDFWQGVSASEVAAYVTNFCGAYRS